MSVDSPKKLVIDTDCGVDDALALLLAFSEQTVAEVVALTCCFGNTTIDNVCENVKRVLTVCGKKVPIYRGSKEPLYCVSGQIGYSKIIHGDDGFGGFSKKYPTGDLRESVTPAAMALVQLAKENPGQITLVAIGPLTNLAIAHHLDPNFTSNLKRIVCMGGGYTGIGNVTEVAEFNMFMDPEAGFLLFRECICPLSLVPLETTHANAIEWEVFNKLIEVKTAKASFYRDITKTTVDRRRTLSGTYHDPDVLAVAAAMYPECIKSTLEGSLNVECGGTYSRGLVILKKIQQDEKQKKITIITDFHDHFLTQLRFQSIQH